MSRNLLLFFIMCLVWGLTWWPTKVATFHLPPFFIAAVRFTVAGALMLLMAGRGRFTIPKALAPRLVATALMMNFVTYGLVFWGIVRAPIGVAAAVNFAGVPLCSLLFGALLGQENLTGRKMFAVGLGTAGLIFLFSTRTGNLEGELYGLAAVLAATGTYCLGAVHTRPLANAMPLFALAGWQMMIGGLALALLSWSIEPIGWAQFSALAQWPVWPSMAFIILGGSLIGFPIYTHLMRDWGPFKTALFAFVSPAFAILPGILALGETISLAEILGMALMFGGAGLALGRRGA